MHITITPTLPTGQSFMDRACAGRRPLTKPPFAWFFFPFSVYVAEKHFWELSSLLRGGGAPLFLSSLLRLVCSLRPFLGYDVFAAGHGLKMTALVAASLVTTRYPPPPVPSHLAVTPTPVFLIPRASPALETNAHLPSCLPPLFFFTFPKGQSCDFHQMFWRAIAYIGSPGPPSLLKDRGRHKGETR